MPVPGVCIRSLSCVLVPVLSAAGTTAGGAVPVPGVCIRSLSCVLVPAPLLPPLPAAPPAGPLARETPLNMTTIKPNKITFNIFIQTPFLGKSRITININSANYTQ